MSISTILDSLLDAPTKKRLGWAKARWTALALLDAAGIALVLPLAQLLMIEQGEELGAPASWIAELLGKDNGPSLLLPLAILVVVLFVTKSIGALILLRANLRTIHNAEVQTTERLIRSYLTASFAFHTTRSSARLQRTLSDSMRRVFEDTLATSVPAAGDKAVVALVTAIVFVAAPIPSVVIALYLVVVFAAYSRLSSRVAVASSEALLSQHEGSIRYIQQALSSIREVRLTGSVDYFASRLMVVRRNIADRQQVISLWEQLPRYYLELVMVFGIAIVGASSAFLGGATEAVGVVGLFAAAGFRIVPGLNRILVARTKSRAAEPHARQLLDDLTDAEAAVQRLDDIVPLSGDARLDNVRLESVTLTYPGAQTPTLRDVGLTIERGIRVGIVGASGAGKSTVVAILLGLLDPDLGRVSINGEDLIRCRSSYQSRIGYVPQEVAVLEGTIRENVAFGCPPGELDDDELWRALAQAELDQVIRNLPSQLDEQVGESGGRLSGGQRQRLGLAHALVRRPELLVLDEATSALDPQIEQRILATLRSLGTSLTTVTIAHRTSAVVDSDIIHLLDNGVISASGSYAELERTSQAFNDLMRLNRTP